MVATEGVNTDFQQSSSENVGYLSIIALFPALCYPEVVKNFSDLSLPPELCQGLSKRGILIPTPVQSEVIPLALAGENLIFQSETGTGKTLCYLLPAFIRCLEPEPTKAPRVLVIAPTHELASQIKQESLLLAESSSLPVTSALCIGGAPLKRQMEMLKQKPSIVLGGPARILELIRLKKLNINALSMLVLDETDRMLAPEMRDIIADLLSVIPQGVQLLACSATVSNHHAKVLEGMVRKPLPETTGDGHYLRLVRLPPEDVLKRNISHWAFYSEGRDKIDNLRKFILAEKPARALVFTAIVGQVENIVEKLVYRGIPCSGLHAKLDKIGRKKSLDDFRSGRTTVLVTSDLAARGLDIPGITHIVQMDVNENEDFFIHRAGRTARAGKSGINAVFGDERELINLSRIEKRLGIVVYPKLLYGGAVRTPEQDGEENLADGNGQRESGHTPQK